MKIFQIKNNRVTELREIGGKKVDDYEKMIQKLVENNLETIFPELEFVDSEFQIDGLRPDSIAFNNESKSFAIIEYKNVKHAGVIDQGMAYLDLLNDKKEAFILLYNNKKSKLYDPSEINWDETRIIIIAPEFSPHQLRASKRTELPIELYEIKKFGEDVVALNRIHETETSITNDNRKTIPRIILGEYVEGDYLAGKYHNQFPTTETIDLWKKLKNRILQKFQNLEFKQKKIYAGYYSKDDGSCICTAEIFKSKIQLCYSTNKDDLIKPSEFIRDVSNIGHHGIGNYSSTIENVNDIELALPYIEQVYHLKVK